MKRQTVLFALASLLIGVMISLHFSIEQDTPERDTRDLWEIRTALLEEQERQQTLQEELNRLKSIEADYQGNHIFNQIHTLRDQISQLQDQAGLTELSDEGIELTLTANFTEADQDEGFPQLTAELLNRLINELNVYGAKHLAVGNERIVQNTAIRDVTGQVYVNRRPISDLPVTISILTDNPDRLKNYMEVGQSVRDLQLHNIKLEMDVRDNITLVPYTDNIVVDYAKISDYNEEGES